MSATGHTIGAPLHKHNCLNCKFLGTTEDEVDLYYCGQGHSMPTVIARYGSLGHQYTSGLAVAARSPWLGEAKARAVAQGLLSDEEQSRG